jgi:NADPH2:quinone reductase
LAATCTAIGKPLEITKQVKPQLVNNQVRVLVKHAALNFSDVLKVQGKYQEKASLPYVPGSEITGEIIEIGPRVSQLRTGDHVICLLTVSDGGFAQESVALENQCFKIESNATMSPAEGASLIISYGTAQLALSRRANIKSSDTVLVTAAAGALGLAAVDLAANVYGANVIGACGGKEKCELVQKYGAKATIDYTNENLRDRLKEITKGKGVDIIVDVVGGKVLEDSLKNIAYEGRVLTLGYTSGDIPKIPANILLVKNFSVHGVYWGSYSKVNPAVFKDSVDTVIKLWLQGKIKPHVGKIFPLEQVNEAIASLQQRQSTGKVILDCEKY